MKEDGFDAMVPPKYESLEVKNREKMSEERNVEEESVLESTAAEAPTRIGAPSEPPSSFTSVEVNEIDANLYLGDSARLWLPRGARGVYGGQIIGQSLNAAMKTVQSNRNVHSLHAYFLMAGDAKKNIIYQVKPLREGKSFSSRLVLALQAGSPIFVLIASFQSPHIGRQIKHQMQMPAVPSPSHTVTMEEYYEMLISDPRCPPKYIPYLRERTKTDSPIDMRPIKLSDFFAKYGPPPPLKDRPTHFPEIATQPSQAFWIRAKRVLPDDPAVHYAVLAYISDMGLLSSAKGETSSMDLGVIASLDHSMWFHAPFRADNWLLYYVESTRAESGRGLSFGFVFTEEKVLAVTVAQEGLLRLRERPKVKL